MSIADSPLDIDEARALDSLSDQIVDYSNIEICDPKKANVFVSFKHKDESGSITKDFAMAEDLFVKASERNIAIFFSPTTLQAYGISDFKRSIEDALDSSDIMIVVDTCSDRVRSPWVQYEWDTFHTDVLNRIKPEGKLFTYVKGIAVNELPRVLRQG